MVSGDVFQNMDWICAYNLLVFLSLIDGIRCSSAVECERLSSVPLSSYDVRFFCSLVNRSLRESRGSLGRCVLNVCYFVDHLLLVLAPRWSLLSCHRIRLSSSD